MQNKAKTRRNPDGFQVVLTKLCVEIVVFGRIIPKMNRLSIMLWGYLFYILIVKLLLQGDFE